MKMIQERSKDLLERSKDLLGRSKYTECPVTFGTLSKHYFSAPNEDIKIPKDIVCRGSFAILSNVLQAK